MTLEGNVVRLEPLRREHASVLWSVAKDAVEDLFRWVPYRMGSLDDFQAGIEKILAEQARGLSLPFVTVECNSGRVIGSTRFMNMDLPNRRVEIGSTWIAPQWATDCREHRGQIPDAAPRLRDLGMPARRTQNRFLNQKSRNAILRLGAKEEGTLRQHMVTWDGRRRDSVYFSILDAEWPRIKARLEEKLG